MSSTILTNWTVYYSDDAGAGAGHKQIKWTGTTGTNTVNELYSALTDLFSDESQNDAQDSIPMVAVTPTLYEIGLSDAGDENPWFIDPDSVQHLTGGGINSSSWTRVQDENIGIVKITRSGSTNIVAGDIGATITNTTGGDSGILLHINGNTLWIRPDSSDSSDNWDTTGGSNDLTCNSHTDTQATAATSGENIWANIYTIGTIEDETSLYVYQDDSQISSWWTEGHIDVLVLVQDFGSLIDYGYLTIYARKYTTLYENFTTDASTGGRIPIPMGTEADLNNINGYTLLECSSGTGAFTEGEVIGNNTTRSSATALGIITNVGGTVADPDLDIYSIGDLTAFTGTDTIYGYNSGENADVDTVSATGPNAGTAATITVTFGNEDTYDIDNDTTDEPYSVVIDCQQVPLDEVYERLKYLTRRGATGDIDDGSQSVIGEQYEAVGDYYIPYDNLAGGTFSEGGTLSSTDQTTFSATITSDYDRGASDGFLIVRNVSGTVPTDGQDINDGTASADVDDNAGADPVVTITQTNDSPFGTFAGGKFFGARGVLLIDVPAADGNNYELIDSEGNPRTPPQTIALEVNSVASGDRVTMFRATGDNNTVDKSVYTSTASGNNAGDADLVVQEAIANDTPSTGTVRTVNNSGDGTEQRYRYSSWATSTFTFVTGATGSATAGSSGDTLVDSGADFGGTDDVEVGDIIRNTSTGQSGRIVEITNTTTLVTSRLSSGWTSGNNYDTNVLDRGYDGSDTAYAPFIDTEAVGTSVSESVTYVTDRYVTTRVRRIGILPFKVKGQVTTSGLTVTAIRTTDTIVDLPG